MHHRYKSRQLTAAVSGVMLRNIEDIKGIRGKTNGLNWLHTSKIGNHKWYLKSKKWKSNKKYINCCRRFKDLYAKFQPQRLGNIGLELKHSPAGPGGTRRPDGFQCILHCRLGLPTPVSYTHLTLPTNREV